MDPPSEERQDNNELVMALNVKSLEQQTRAVHVARDASVLDLKLAVQSVFEVDSERQRLIFQGKVLKDEKQLADYGKSSKD